MLIKEIKFGSRSSSIPSSSTEKRDWTTEKKIHFHVSTSLRANSSGYSDDLCKYYCNSLSVYSQCDRSQFAGVFFVTFALTIFIIIHSSLSTATTYSKSLLFWKDAIPFCVVEIETAQTSQLKKNSAKPQYFHCITAKQRTLFSTFLTRSGLPPLCQSQIWAILGFYRERHVKGRGPVETSRREEFEQKSKLIFSSWEGRGKTSLSCPSNLFIRCQICEDLDRFHQIWSALSSRLLTYIPLSLNQ